MDAFATMADQLQGVPAHEQLPPESDSKAGRMRQELRDNGPQTARRLAEVAGVANSGLVGALLKHDLHTERVKYSSGYYRWNEHFVQELAAAVARPGALLEVLEWREVGDGNFPDADLTVLVRLRNNEEPVWLGYWDDEEWRDLDGQPVDVVRWADIPKGGEV